MLTKAMAVLSMFSPDRTEIGVIEAAELLNRSKSTVSRWLSTMEKAGFLDRDDARGRYRLGMRLAALGELARRSTSLQRLARPSLEQLAAATGETSDLVVLSGSDAMNLDMVESPRPLKHVGWIGRQLPLHATASGKTLLAWLDAGEAEALLADPLERYTAATITDRGVLLAELEQIRREGYAVAWGELEADLVGVAAPIRDHGGRVVGVITIGAPMSRVARESLPVVSGHVVEAAVAVSRRLGHRQEAIA